VEGCCRKEVSGVKVTRETFMGTQGVLSYGFIGGKRIEF
jgi:hypothetical protein